jgi:hypothetical protein
MPLLYLESESVTEVLERWGSFFSTQPYGTLGPLGLGFTSAANPEDVAGWAVGFHHERPNDSRAEPTKLLLVPAMLAESHVDLDGRASMGETPRTNSDRG